MTVVLGYEDSPGAEQALETAIMLASRFGEDLVCVYGVAPPGLAGEESRTHREAILELAREMVSRAVERARSASVEARVALVDAKPADALIQVADECDARVIVVGTSSESPLRGAILGSTPHKLLHLSTRPVLCVPAPS